MVRREELKQLEFPKTVNSHQWLTIKDLGSTGEQNQLRERIPEPTGHKLQIDLCSSNLAVGH